MCGGRKIRKNPIFELLVKQLQTAELKHSFDLSQGTYIFVNFVCHLLRKRSKVDRIPCTDRSDSKPFLASMGNKVRPEGLCIGVDAKQNFCVSK